MSLEVRTTFARPRPEFEFDRPEPAVIERPEPAFERPQVVREPTEMRFDKYEVYRPERPQDFQYRGRCQECGHRLMGTTVCFHCSVAPDDIYY